MLPGSEGWPHAVMRPGEHPLAALGRTISRMLPDRALGTGDASATLDAALAGLAAGQRMVVAVDQFEEVFTATRDDAERSAFIDLLTSERTGLKVIVAMRADHYGRCAAYPALAHPMGADHVLVGPLTAVELAAVVEQPAQRVGLQVETGLTEALVADAGSEPGVLPLLCTSLLELWQAREDHRLTLAAYRASGGLRGAVARLAEAAYAELDPYRRSIARAIFLRLAGPGEGEELVRRRVPLTELDVDRDPAVGAVLESLTAARLLTSGEGYVEVAHEALLREWPRLQGWLDEDAAGRRVRLHLIGAVRDWEQRGREPGDLYRGARLAAALEWAAEHPMEQNEAERTFLDESRQTSEREVERQRRVNRRLRALLAGAAVLLVVAVGASGFAAVQAQRAEEQRTAAEDQRVIAEEQSRLAEEQRILAEEQGGLAEEQRIAADEQRTIAEHEADRARSRELTASAIAALDEDPRLSKLLSIKAAHSATTTHFS